MKVVINTCFGGFGLSDAAVERCLELGMTVTKYREDGWGHDDATADFVIHHETYADHLDAVSEYDDGDEMEYRRYEIMNDRSPDFRCDPRVIQAVEELGQEANTAYSKLKVIDIPVDGPDGWLVDEYHDGKESVVAIKERWR